MLSDEQIRPVASVDPFVVDQSEVAGDRLRDPEGALGVGRGAAAGSRRENSELIEAAWNGPREILNPAASASKVKGGFFTQINCGVKLRHSTQIFFCILHLHGGYGGATKKFLL